MKRIAISLLSFSLLLLIGAVLPARGATVSEVLAEIESHSLALRATAASNEAAELELRSDNTLPPLSVEYSPFFRSGVSGVASSELVVSQEFDFPTLYGARGRQAAAERAALDGAAATERRALRLDAHSRLLTLLLLREEREILAMRISDAETLLDLYGKSLENGKATILEVNKVKLELQELRRQWLQNQADIEAQCDALQGLNGGQPLDLSDLQHDLPAERLGEVSADAASLLAADPSVRAAEAEVEAARRGVGVARAGWWPSLTLGYR
ncbi:MAG: TolC family protein, partial [Muribaculaceae bacterium]|nr:TolC family protein [Muribaculaceae bacterium]